MKFRIARAAAVTAVVAAAVAAPAAAQTPDNRPGIAVLPFAAGISLGDDARTLDALSIGLQQILITELANNSGLRVVDRSVIRDLIAEIDLGTSGRVDAQTAARIGRLVGARYVIAGGFNDIEGTFRLDGRIVDVETSEILKADQVSDRRANLYRIITTFGNRITDGVNLPPLPRAEREQQEARAQQAPPQAISLYSLAKLAEDTGKADEARNLYRRITTEFPQFTPAREALRQMGGGE